MPRDGGGAADAASSSAAAAHFRNVGDAHHLIALGKGLEAHAKGRASDTPASCSRSRRRGDAAHAGRRELGARVLEERVIDAGLLQPGDVVLVRGGERVPCDGELPRALGRRRRRRDRRADDHGRSCP